MSLVFHLKNQLPPGRKHNDIYPELEATYTFLHSLDGLIFDDEEQFREVLNGFSAYLKLNRVAPGPDHRLREGIFLVEQEGRSGRLERQVGPYTKHGDRLMLYGRLEEA